MKHTASVSFCRAAEVCDLKESATDGFVLEDDLPRQRCFIEMGMSWRKVSQHPLGMISSLKLIRDLISINLSQDGLQAAL